jgi:hypothetical protein
MDRTAQIEPLTTGQSIVAKWEGPSSPWSEPADLAEAIDVALALEYERGKLHGSDDRRMIEQQNRVQGQEIDRLKGEIAKLKRELHLWKQPPTQTGTRLVGD